MNLALSGHIHIKEVCTILKIIYEIVFNFCVIILVWFKGDNLPTGNL